MTTYRNFHGEQLTIGEEVFELGRGRGKVTDFVGDDILHVEFENGTFGKYKTNGVPLGKGGRTMLYWRDPVVFAPAKDEADFNRLIAIMAVVRDQFRQARG